MANRKPLPYPTDAYGDIAEPSPVLPDEFIIERREVVGKVRQSDTYTGRTAIDAALQIIAAYLNEMRPDENATIEFTIPGAQTFTVKVSSNS